VSPETIAIPSRAAYWIKLPNHNVRVYMAPRTVVPVYKEVYTRGLDWPSLASAVTALEVDTWCELSQARSEMAVLEKTA
jgi:hypothetical protein